MKQVVTRKGAIQVMDVPEPQIRPGTVLVAVRASCISAGTETAGIAASGMGLVERAVKYPERVLDVAELALHQGIGRTLADVKAGLDAAAPLGYSAAGRVRAVGAGVERYTPGDTVACAGAGLANHAEWIVVPENLVAPVPDGVDPRAASTVALGAIAMQGVRRAEPTLGECFVVVGLGLLGQLTIRLLRAAGVRVIGIEPDAGRRALAEAGGAESVLEPGDPGVVEAVQRIAGHGADGAIITAAGSSDEIVSMAFKVCRAKGRVVLVGDVGLGLKREDLYAKELDLRMATSYGPGRYDARYEQGGLDYPIGYVRWTEGRNMEEYLRLLAEARVDLSPLVHGSWPVEEAADAYQALQENPAAPLVFIDYADHDHQPSGARLELPGAPSVEGTVGFAVVGAGAFARSVHLPNLDALDDAQLITVVSRDGLNARETADRFGARSATTSLDEALGAEDVSAVLISTRHDLHVDQTLAALEAGRHVLVEKPLALTAEGLDRIEAFYSHGPDDRPILLTGFNRRFSPFARRLREALADRTGPLVLSYRMNAGYLPPDHWVHGPEGGGRNLGEACHIYDLFVYLVDEPVVDIDATPVAAPGGHDVARDNFTATLRFADGSLCTLTYTAVGHPDLPKERLEAFWDGRAAVLDDYRSIAFHGGGKGLRRRQTDKGHAQELAAFLRAIRQGGPWPIPLWQQLEATRAALKVEEKLTGRPASEPEPS